MQIYLVVFTFSVLTLIWVGFWGFRLELEGGGGGESKIANPPPPLILSNTC